MDWTRRLIDEMVSVRYVVSPGERPQEYLVEGRGDHRYEHPVLLRVDPQQLERCIAITGQSADLLYPGVEPMEAGYRLMTIHLDEAVDSDLPPMQAVWFEDGEIKYTPLDGWEHPLADAPKGDYSWTTTRPGKRGRSRNRGSGR